MLSTLHRFSSLLLSGFAGLAAFLLTLGGFLLLGTIDQQIAASIVIGLFALAIVWMAAERPNAGQARAISALIDRLLAVGRGDLSSPAPAVLREQMPALASAVDGLFEQVRSTLDDVHALAMYDPVTALPNRVHFRREAERVLEACGRDECSALLFIDLDGFKEVNDRLGHAQGDQVLTMVANRLRVVIQAEAGTGAAWQPLIARLAGDEFTMLLPGIGRAEAERIAARVVDALAEPFGSAGKSSYLGASIGVALCPDHGGELTVLMKAADIAMYHAKASGRSRTCIYHPRLAEASEKRASSDTALRSAVDRGEMDLAFRPRLCLRSGAITGADALIRWNRPGEPSRILDGDALDDRGAGVDIAHWALAAGTQALARWHALDLPQLMSIRMERHQLQRGDCFARLREALAAAGPPPWRLEIEIPEALMAECDGRMLIDLAAVREDGVTVAVSDFGAGGAALAPMAQFPADRVKLAPPLAAQIDRCPKSRSIAAALIHMLHGLGMEAVATGLERQEQLDVLRAMGCDAVQGFLGLDPMAEAEFVAWASGQDCAHSLARAS
jgi:diguanylate cyclase (GGDEF)-like protein